MHLPGPGAISAHVAEPPPGGDVALDRLAALALEHGHCDARILERGRRVAAESGWRLDEVLIQFGLISQHGLPLALPDRSPQDGPLLADRLGARFLRAARAVPVAQESRQQGIRLLVAVADPLDTSTRKGHRR